MPGIQRAGGGGGGPQPNDFLVGLHAILEASLSLLSLLVSHSELLKEPELHLLPGRPFGVLIPIYMESRSQHCFFQIRSN
jgi:hypothetical protein